MALDEEVPEFKESDDKTVPKYRQIDKRAGPYVVEWGVELEQAYNDIAAGRPPPVHAGVKRASKEEGGGSQKKVKQSASQEDGVGPDMEKLKGLVAKGKVGSATVAQLKEWATALGLATSGRKADLVERVEEHFESK
jgi:ATP-dependent DNA helicase 2 subunit 1